MCEKYYFYFIDEGVEGQYNYKPKVTQLINEKAGT